MIREIKVKSILRKHNEYKDIPFIFLTAKTYEDDRLRALQMGAVDFIHKPFSIVELKAKIDTHLRMQQAQKESGVKEMKLKIFEVIGSGLIGQDRQYMHFDNMCNKYNVTKRERDFINLLTQGYEYKEIGGMLNISLNTVKPYIRDIYKKLHVQNKIELINFFNSDTYQPHSNTGGTSFYI